MNYWFSRELRTGRFSAEIMREVQKLSAVWNMTLLGAATVVGGIILTKFMMSLRDENFRVLTGAAIDRGISVQELLRAVIIPDWVKETPRGIVANTLPSFRVHR
jgi:hypothetical protein